MVKWQTMNFTRQAEAERPYAPVPTPRAAGADTLQAIHDALAQGHSLDQAAEAANLSRSALDDLRQHDPDFADTVERGMDAGEARCAGWLRSMATGVPGDVPGWFQEDDAAMAQHMAEVYGWDTAGVEGVG